MMPILPLALLAFVPVGPLLAWLALPAPYVFAAAAIAVGILADWVRRSTEQLSTHTGAAIGGLLTISFGSLSEVILAAFVLLDGKTDVVRAQFTGSIMGTSLLGLGLAIVAGGIGRERQSFKRERAGLLSSLLVLVLIALLLPAVFDLAERLGPGAPHRLLSDQALSIGVAIVLLGLYCANLAYTLVTHRDVFASGEPDDDTAKAWPLWLCLAVLVAATAAVSYEAELVSTALESTSGSLGLSPVFLGVVVLALVGTVSDLFAAIAFARAGRLGLVMSICIGSAIQVALVVAPLLVLLGWALGKPLTLVFAPLDLFAIAGTALIVNAIAGDGETTWFEGVLLIGVYLLLALAFFFVG